MPIPILLHLMGRNLPRIRQPFEWKTRQPSTINEKTVGDFTRVIEQTGILDRKDKGQD